MKLEEIIIMETLRVGVIGLGIGRHHLRAYTEHPRAHVTAIADTDVNRLAEIGDEYGVEGRYQYAEEMLSREKFDIVSIATPNIYHKPLSIMALEGGAHVLCEKPMAMNAEEAQEMVSVSERTGKRLMINFSFRFREESQAMKREVEAGTLGNIYFGRTVWHRRRGIPRFGGWFGQKRLSGGGPLIDLGVHRLDLALWLMGYPEPLWVMGSAYNHLGSALADKAGVDFSVEDLAVGLIRFNNGATLEVEASWAGNIQEKELMETRLLGTDGGLLQKNIGGGYDLVTELYIERNGSMFDMRLDSASAAKSSSMAHFVDAIINDNEHIATGEEGMTVMKLLDAIYLSAERETPVNV